MLRGAMVWRKSRLSHHVTLRLGPTFAGSAKRPELVHSGVHPSSRPKRVAHQRSQPPLRLARPSLRACLATTSAPTPSACDTRNMAPNKHNEPSPEYIQEREDFLETLEKYHEKRG